MMNPDMLYVISPEEQNRETLTEILTAHPEIKFVSFMGVDFAGNDTDEKVPISLFLKDIDGFLEGMAAQTDGSSVVLTGIATLNNARVDMKIDSSVNWYIDYNYEHFDSATGRMVGTLRIPCFLVHNNVRVDSRSILHDTLDYVEKELLELFKKHPQVAGLEHISGEDIEKIIFTCATELEFWVKSPREDAPIEALSSSQMMQEQYWQRCRGNVRTALEQTVEMLEASGLMVNVEDYDNKVGFSERANVPIEPRLSMQWFLKMQHFADMALPPVMNDDLKFYPAKYKNTYKNWLENIKDWCISRQLWWGQRIPAWYLPQGGYVVALNADEALEKARAKSGDASLTLADLRQDEDVLDTWFSSWLWPISVFDGIRNPGNREISYYYPTNDLVTGPDIIFFWVARMIMAGYEYRGEKPFGNVYFTGIVRDKIGRKMSKQLGNSPDPLDLIAKYGADGMRMAMLISSSAGNDVMFDEALCEQGRNFGNKIWNAYRLVNGWSADGNAAQDENNRLAVAWFRQTLGVALRQIADDFGCYRISEAFKTTYKLFWDDFSGLYLEMVKPAYGQPIDAPTFEATRTFFDSLMRVLHPFMPFVTEEIWQDLAPRKEGESITVAPMPQPDEIDGQLLARFELAREVISSVRNVRNQKNLPQKEALTLKVIADENYPAEYAPVMRKMANLTAIETVTEKDPAAAAFIVKTTQYFVPMAGKIDAEAERRKLTDELSYQEGFLASVMKKLSNERFMQSAPEKVVANERAKQADAEAKIAAIKAQLEALS